jgi:hypothetical protein
MFGLSIYLRILDCPLGLFNIFHLVYIPIENNFIKPSRSEQDQFSIFRQFSVSALDFYLDT